MCEKCEPAKKIVEEILKEMTKPTGEQKND